MSLPGSDTVKKQKRPSSRVDRRVEPGQCPGGKEESGAAEGCTGAQVCLGSVSFVAGSQEAEPSRGALGQPPPWGSEWRALDRTLGMEALTPLSRRTDRDTEENQPQKYLQITGGRIISLGGVLI